MGLRWRGVLLVEGVETGDHRMIEAGATRWRSLPLDFRAVFEDGWGAHEGATPVATIDLIERRDGGQIYAEGPLIIGDENADRWANLNTQGALRGVSVDLTGGSARIEIVEEASGEVLPEEVGIELLWGPNGDAYYMREVWSDAEIGAATAVGTPAFAEGIVEVYDDTAVAAAPVAAEEESSTPALDAIAASGAAFASIDDVEVGTEVSWTDDEGTERSGTITAVDTDAEEVTVDVGDGEEVVVAVSKVTVADSEDDTDEGDGGGFPGGGNEEAGTRYPGLAARLPQPAPRPALAALLARERGDVVQASAFRGGGALVAPAISWGDGPPRAAFEREADGPTPFTIEDDGTVYGHIALWGQCHTGFAGAVLEQCLMPTASPSNYALFHASGQVRCDDGSRLEVGVITMDTGHAPAGVPGRRPSAKVVRAHYDNTGLGAMQVRVRDDEWGPFACGILSPGLSVDDARRAMAANPSGDWRNYGSGLDLLGLLMVNVPGYPVYEVEDGAVTMLVASLSPPSDFTPRTKAEATPKPSCSCGGHGTAQAGAGTEPIRFPALALRALDRAMA